MPSMIQVKRGTAAQWTSANPILAVGEFGHETDTHQFKIGDGTTAWNSLAYETHPDIVAATNVNTVNAIVKRDNTGRIKISDPSNNQDAATKSYVDGMGYTQISAPASNVPSSYPTGVSIWQSATGTTQGYPVDFITVFTVKQSTIRMFQLISDKVTGSVWVNYPTTDGTAWSGPFKLASTSYVDAKTWLSTAISDSTATGRSVLTAASTTAARTAIGAGTSNLAIGTTSTTAKAGNYQPTAANISDASAVGRSVLTAVDAATARTAIGAGISDLVIGTTSTTAKAGDYQPTAANISDASMVGRSVLTAIDAATARTAIGAGTSNLTIGTTSTTAKAGDYQPTAANISDSTAVGRSVLTAADATTARTAIGAGTSSLVIGTTSTTAKAGDYQPTAANISDSTATGRALLTAASAASARTTLSVPSVSGGITDIVQLTQAAYDALGTKVATTLYVIVG